MSYNKDLGIYLFTVYGKQAISNKIQVVFPLKYQLGCKSGCAGGIKFCISFDLVPKDALSEKSIMTLYNKVHAKWI